MVALIGVLLLVGCKIYTTGSLGGIFGTSSSKKAMLAIFNGASKGVDNPAMMT